MYTWFFFVFQYLTAIYALMVLLVAMLITTSTIIIQFGLTMYIIIHWTNKFVAGIDGDVDIYNNMCLSLWGGEDRRNTFRDSCISNWVLQCFWQLSWTVLVYSHNFKSIKFDRWWIFFKCHIWVWVIYDQCRSETSANWYNCLYGISYYWFTFSMVCLCL